MSSDPPPSLPEDGTAPLHPSFALPRWQGKMPTPALDVQGMLSGLGSQAFQAHVTRMNESLAGAALAAKIDAATVAPGLIEAQRRMKSQSAIWKDLARASARAGQQLAAYLDRWIPSNFRGLTLDQQVRVIALSTERKFGAFDSVPPATLEALLETSYSEPEATLTLLAKDADSVLEDCRATVLAIRDSANSESDRAGLVVAAVDAYRAGHAEAAQALATVAWDSHISANFAPKPITEMKRRGGGGEVDLEAGLSDLYLKAAWGPAISCYGPSRSGTLYSRSDTVHDASSTTLSATQGLCAITIATGVFAHSQRWARLDSG